MELKRLNQIKENDAPSLKDVIEITSENILTTSKHSKDIKVNLKLIIESLNDISSRLSALEAKNSSIFQVEIDESDDDTSPDILDNDGDDDDEEEEEEDTPED